MALDNLFKKIEAIGEFDIVSESQIIISKNSEILINLLRDQLSKGIDANNEPVFAKYGPYYADSTEFSKSGRPGLSGVTSHVTNYMSGVFYSSIKARIEGSGFAFYSNIEYFSAILKRSGTVAMQLNKENLRYFSENILIPQLQKAWLTKTTR